MRPQSLASSASRGVSHEPPTIATLGWLAGITTRINLASTVWIVPYRHALVTAKAFALGLTSSVVLPAMEDDPHGAFNDMNALRTVTTQLGKILDGFMGDLAAVPDTSCGGTTLADNLVMTIHGDTPKNPLDRGGWPDGTPQNSNWIYVYGNGLLKTGWHGGVDADGTVRGWSPTTGEDAATTSREASGQPVAG